MRFYLPILAAGAIAAGACADQGAPTGPSGPKLNIDIAALNLQGVDDAVWDIEVTNGKGEIVFNTRVSSSAFGDSKGSATYIGTCDASSDASQNTVSVWVVGLYDRDISISDAGGFNAAAPTGSLAFQNPTWIDTNNNGVRDAVVGAEDANSPLTQTKLCTENADNFFAFNVALMRPANQGFFDIAVNFNDIFCSAKYDCGSADLLFDGSVPPKRANTNVFGFACTAGEGTAVNTELLLDDIVINCPGAGGDDDNVTTILVDNDANLCDSPVAANSDATSQPGCGGKVTFSGTTTPLFQAAVYRGTEDEDSGQAIRYWNVALGIKDVDFESCSVAIRATADDGDSPALANDTIADGQVYPYINFNLADLTSCNGNETEHSLNSCLGGATDFPTCTNDTPSSMVTAYSTTSGTGSAKFGHAWTDGD